ncbi:MAG: CYTH domain-containing protein [Pseudomonadales bacterium]|nr:CYTH domain-containing protein [Pseudomonadales bacterium]
MSIEIERQFILNRLPPDLEDHFHIAIRQGYLSVTENEEVRIRSIAESYTLTVKQGQGLVRKEINVDLQEQQFEGLWPGTEGRRITKTRYFYLYNGHQLHIDIYGGELQGLNVVEVEFKSREEADSFLVTDIFGEEITDVGSFYHIQKLRKRTD